MFTPPCECRRLVRDLLTGLFPVLIHSSTWLPKTLTSNSLSVNNISCTRNSMFQVSCIGRPREWFWATLCCPPKAKNDHVKYHYILNTEIVGEVLCHLPRCNPLHTTLGVLQWWFQKPYTIATIWYMWKSSIVPSIKRRWHKFYILLKKRKTRTENLLAISQTLALWSLICNCKQFDMSYR